MESDRWRTVERLFHAALARDVSERAAFLAEACAGDENLRREVESLVAAERSAESFLALPAMQVAGATSVAESLEARAEQTETRFERVAASLPRWAGLIIVVAIARTAAALTVYLATTQTPAIQLVPPLWVNMALAGTFTVLGMGLAFGNRRDPRAAWLGGIFVLAGTALAPMESLSAPPQLPKWHLHVRPDAFLGSFWWGFLVHFPSDLGRRAGRLVRAAMVASALVGLWCVGANLAALWLAPTSVPAWLAPFLITTTLPGRTYWLVVFGIAVPALPVLVWRAHVAEGDARSRVRLFVSGLLAGVAPFAGEVIVEELSPAYKAWAHAPAVEPWVGALIFGALALVPFMTAYSVLFDRVVEVRVALQTAAQYVLARYTIAGAALIPFAALALFVFEHRFEPMTSLAVGTRPLLLGGFAAFGLVALRLRSRWLHALDRRYFRESYDPREIVTRVFGGLKASSAADLGSGLKSEIDRSLHAVGELFVVDESRTALCHAHDRLPPLGMTATLVGLVLADSRPMDVDLHDEASPLLRLPPDERRWLERGRFGLLIALRGASGVMEGVLAMTPKRSGLPYSADDRRILSAVAAAAGLALDSLRSRAGPESPDEPAARECVKCVRLSPFDSTRCACGGDLVLASVPHMLRGVFRLEQRVGAGGMGVVYRAVDLSLGREVAIKALLKVAPELGTRLRREARAMAAVTHPNLAVVYSVETWQGTPFLVQEFLAGGTLAMRLAVSQPTLDEVLELGVALAGALQYLHGSGIVHCDIKPSNIGFTRHGVVKLLDFGLARIVREGRVTAEMPSTTAGRIESQFVASDAGGAWFGTPPFMSPEAVRGQRPAPSFDLWALAVVLFESVAGRRPFGGDSAFEILARILSGPTPDIRDLRPDVPPPVAAFFAAALHPDVAQRPHDGLAFAAALRDLPRQSR